MNANVNTNQAPEYFNSVLYARAYLNEIKIITPTRGENYCAVNATVTQMVNGEKRFTTLDLIVRGASAKRALWAVKDRWPTDRFSREGERWIADINVGSINSSHFPKKDGKIGAVLKGRLINIRGLCIGDEVVYGEWQEAEEATYHVVCYINDLDVAKNKGKVAALDGPTNKPNYTSVNVSFKADNFTELGEMVALGLCPKGYANRATNPKVFALLVLTNLYAEGFEGREGKPASCLKGNLSEIRYLKADDAVLVGKTAVA